MGIKKKHLLYKLPILMCGLFLTFSFSSSSLDKGDLSGLSDYGMMTKEEVNVPTEYEMTSEALKALRNKTDNDQIKVLETAADIDHQYLLDVDSNLITPICDQGDTLLAENQASYTQGVIDEDTFNERNKTIRYITISESLFYAEILQEKDYIASLPSSASSIIDTGIDNLATNIVLFLRHNIDITNDLLYSEAIYQHASMIYEQSTILTSNQIYLAKSAFFTLKEQSSDALLTAVVDYLDSLQDVDYISKTIEGQIETYLITRKEIFFERLVFQSSTSLKSTYLSTLETLVVPSGKTMLKAQYDAALASIEDRTAFKANCYTIFKTLYSNALEKAYQEKTIDESYYKEMKSALEDEETLITLADNHFTSWFLHVGMEDPVEVSEESFTGSLIASYTSQVEDIKVHETLYPVEIAVLVIVPLIFIALLVVVLIYIYKKARSHGKR